MATMLPAVPNSLGRLSEVYESCLLSVLEKDNPLGLPKSKSACVVLVDGLGLGNLKSASAYARFLFEAQIGTKPLYCGFPTTTATSIVSFATGKESGEHGFIGYRVYDRSRARPINFLNDLVDDLDPLRFQKLETVSEKAKRLGVRSYVVGPASYATSGFTKATMRGAIYVAADKIADRFSKASELLSKPGNLVYLYIPELDQAAHRFGTASVEWLNLLENLDSEVRVFSESIPRNAIAVLTADHGIVDVPKSQHIYLDEHEDLFNDLVMVGGDPRVAYLYWPEGLDLKSKISEISKRFEGKLAVLTPTELVQLGWFSPIVDSAKNWVPDLVLVCVQNGAIYHKGFAKSKSLEMVGQHGSWSKMEREVPLLLLRG
jgi:predicted AlkP superfamily pyrophosphatase or phosphodiesterase